MPIGYDKLFQVMNNRGITIYRLRKDKVLGTATLDKLKQGGDIDTRSIAKLCAYLQCQPGDILEYIPSEKEGKSHDL